jgi:hypothetical protein
MSPIIWNKQPRQALRIRVEPAGAGIVVRWPDGQRTAGPSSELTLCHRAAAVIPNWGNRA